MLLTHFFFPTGTKSPPRNPKNPTFRRIRCERSVSEEGRRSRGSWSCQSEALWAGAERLPAAFLLLRQRKKRLTLISRMVHCVSLSLYMYCEDCGWLLIPRRNIAARRLLWVEDPRDRRRLRSELYTWREFCVLKARTSREEFKREKKQWYEPVLADEEWVRLKVKNSKKGARSPVWGQLCFVGKLWPL